MDSSRPKHYRALRDGPEAALQYRVEKHLLDLFPNKGRLVWTAGSVPLGAGCTDIILTACLPQIVALNEAHADSHALLAYLRAGGRAKAATISPRCQLKPRSVLNSLSALVESGIVIKRRDIYWLSSHWRSIFSEV